MLLWIGPKIPWNLSQNSMEFSSMEFMYPNSMEFIYLKTSMEPQNLSQFLDNNITYIEPISFCKLCGQII